MGDAGLKPADVVKDQNGDELVVLWADNDAGDWMAAGWPQVVGRIADVTLVKSATDEESRELVQRIRDGQHPYRSKVLHLHDGVPAMRGEVDKGGLDHFVESVCRDVAELPDRTSPDDWPAAMLVTADELEIIIRNNAYLAALPSDGWRGISELRYCRETARGLIIRAPSLFHADFNPDATSWATLVSDDLSDPLCAVKWNGSHDCWDSIDVRDATHFRLTPYPPQDVAPTPIADTFDPIAEMRRRRELDADLIVMMIRENEPGYVGVALANLYDELAKDRPSPPGEAAQSDGMREALEFYADRSNYHDTPNKAEPSVWVTAKVLFDGGKRARAALEGAPASASGMREALQEIDAAALAAMNFSAVELEGPRGQQLAEALGQCIKIARAALQPKES